MPGTQPKLHLAIYTPWSHLSQEYQSILSWNTWAFSWSIYTHGLFTDTRVHSPPKYRKTTEQQPLLTASWLPFLVSIFSPPFPLRNSCILPEGSLTSPKSHSDTSKCLLKGPVLSEGPKAQQTLPEHWPLWAYSPTALAHPHLSAFKSLCHLLISNYQIFQWNNLFLSSAHY